MKLDLNNLRLEEETFLSEVHGRSMKIKKPRQH